MKIAFYGDSLTAGIPGVSYFNILRQRLPEHELLNFGQPDDTVLSLYQRIVEDDLLEPVDLAFVWIGTNDIPQELDGFVGLMRRLWRKFRSQNPGEFKEYYRALLELLTPYAPHLVTVSPLLNGEDLSNYRNRYLARLGRIVRDVSGEYAGVEYLDVRALFVERLAGRRPTQWQASVANTLRDTLLRTEEEIDERALERGLSLTLDGVHLNSVGARIVADAFEEVIERVAAARQHVA